MDKAISPMRPVGRLTLLLCLLTLLPLLSGCEVFAFNRHTLVKTLPAGPADEVNFKVTLMRSTQDIKFLGFRAVNGNQTLHVSLVNQSHNSINFNFGIGNHVQLPPGGELLIFDGKMLEAEADFIILPENGVSRARCEFKVRIANPPNLTNAVRVYRHNQSAPM